MIVLPLLIVVLVWQVIVYLKWKKNIFDLVEKMPGSRWYPFVGTFLPFQGVSREDILYKFAEVNIKYGPFYRSWNGHTPEVHLMKPEHLQIVMRSSAHVTKGSLYDYLFPWLGEGLFISEGAKWFLQRKLLTPTFHFKILESFMDIFAGKGASIVNMLEHKADGKYFNIIPDISVCTLGAICDAATGVPLDHVTDDPAQYIESGKSLAELAIWRYWHPYVKDPIFYMLPRGRRYNALLKILNNFTNRIIELKRGQYRYLNFDKNAAVKGEDGSAKRTSFLDLVMDATENKNVFSDQDLKYLVNTFLFAGFDTTSNTMSWAVFLLGNNPEMQEKAYDEITKVLKGKDYPTTINELNELCYLERVIKETLRLYPVLPIIARKLTEDVKIDGYTVPAGTQALLHLFDVHRDPAHFPEPNQFDPDRFLAENSKSRHPFAYVPFSAGPRNCIGQRFAFLEMKSILATLLNKYKIRSMHKPEQVKLFAHLVLRPQIGIQVKLEKRENSTNSN